MQGQTDLFPLERLFWHVGRRITIMNVTILILYMLKHVKVLHLHKPHKIKQELQKLTLVN